jgi:hypothetical protein
VIICIDGDVKMQRPFSADEWAWLQGWQDGHVGIGPNEPKVGGDSMGNELVPHSAAAQPRGDAGALWPAASRPDRQCRLCGGHPPTWLKLWQAYLRRWLDTAPLFAHIAVQQWTLNLCINEGFERVVLPQSFHTHGHWGELARRTPAGACTRRQRS